MKKWNHEGTIFQVVSYSKGTNAITVDEQQPAPGDMLNMCFKTLFEASKLIGKQKCPSKLSHKVQLPSWSNSLNAELYFFHATLIYREDHQTPNAFQKPERSENIYIFVYLTNNYLILVPY